jgi:hypothetical protein
MCLPFVIKTAAKYNNTVKFDDADIGQKLIKTSMKP